MEKSPSNTSSNKKLQSTKLLNECKICGVSAKYAYFGVISCHPCKTFFKRNAQQKKELKCDFNGNCEININNRHICAYCRLNKCFRSGMQIKRFQPSVVPKINEQNQEKNSTVLVTSNQIQQFPTLNLLEADRSTLTIEQWNHISNISRCYDEYSGFLMGVHFIREQDRLPVKLRLKNGALIHFTRMALDGLRLLYEKNQDFISLSADDRSLLLHNTFKHTGGLSTIYMLSKLGITDYPMYYDIALTISTPPAVATSRRLAPQLDFDIIIIKLILAILSFSTVSYTVYTNSPSINLSNIKQILHIQDTYTELLWRYLLYQYDFKQAVQWFNSILRCLFTNHEMIVGLEELQWFEEQTDSLVRQTEQSLALNN